MVHSIKEPLLPPQVQDYQRHYPVLVVDYADWTEIANTCQAHRLVEHDRAKKPYGANTVLVDDKVFMVYAGAYCGVGDSYMQAAELIPVELYESVLNESPSRSGLGVDGCHHVGLRCRVNGRDYIAGASTLIFADLPRSAATVSVAEAKAHDRALQLYGGWRAMEYLTVVPSWHFQNGYVMCQYEKHDGNTHWDLFYRDNTGKIQCVKTDRPQEIQALAPAISASVALMAGAQQDLFGNPIIDQPGPQEPLHPDPEIVARIREELEEEDLPEIHLAASVPFLDPRGNTGIAIPLGNKPSGLVLVRCNEDFHIQVYGAHEMRDLPELISLAETPCYESWGVLFLGDDMREALAEWQEGISLGGSVALGQ